MAKPFFKIISVLLCLCFLSQQIGFAQMAVELNLASHLSRMGSSITPDKFRPFHLRYFSYDTIKDDFKFIFDKGDLKDIEEPQSQELTSGLLKYFLIGITLPDSKFWVNLRPDSEDQIIDPELEKTDLGKVLLEADLQLKKDTALMTSPQTPEGREYWNNLYKKVEELFGTETITIPTLTRPWIIPGEIIVRETQDSAFLYKTTLKVMLEQDHLKDSSFSREAGSRLFTDSLAGKDERLKKLNEYSSKLIREKIIPKLTKEVNSSKKYANLRQVFYSLVLSRWFKARYKGQAGTYSSLIDTQNLNGLTSTTDWSKTTYFKAYQKSFKDGEYNISEPVYTPTGQVIRSYFSGGMNLAIGEKAFTGTGAASPINLANLRNYLLLTMTALSLFGAGAMPSISNAAQFEKPGIVRQVQTKSSFFYFDWTKKAPRDLPDELRPRINKLLDMLNQLVADRSTILQSIKDKKGINSNDQNVIKFLDNLRIEARVRTTKPEMSVRYRDRYNNSDDFKIIFDFTYDPFSLWIESPKKGYGFTNDIDEKTNELNNIIYIITPDGIFKISASPEGDRIISVERIEKLSFAPISSDGISAASPITELDLYKFNGIIDYGSSVNTFWGPGDKLGDTTIWKKCQNEEEALMEARTIVTGKIKSLKDVNNLNELYLFLYALREIKGNKDAYTSQELVNIILKVRYDASNARKDLNEEFFNRWLRRALADIPEGNKGTAIEGLRGVVQYLLDSGKPTKVPVDSIKQSDLALFKEFSSNTDPFELAENIKSFLKNRKGETKPVIKLNPNIPTLIIPDLHGRRGLLIELLMAKRSDGETYFEKLTKGKIQIVQLGDLGHTEDRGVWKEIADNYMFQGGFIRSNEAMDSEMANFFGTAAMVMRLQELFPEHFFCIKGNHENIANSDSNGNHEFRKYVQYPGEGELVKQWVEAKLQKQFLEEYKKWEDSLPVFVIGSNFVASHSEPDKPYTLNQINNRDSEAVNGLTWTRNGGVFAREVLKNVFGKADNKYYIAGHTTGLQDIPKNNFFIVNTQEDLTALYIEPGDSIGKIKQIVVLASSAASPITAQELANELFPVSIRTNGLNSAIESGLDKWKVEGAGKNNDRFRFTDIQISISTGSVEFNRMELMGMIGDHFILRLYSSDGTLEITSNYAAYPVEFKISQKLLNSMSSKGDSAKEIAGFLIKGIEGITSLVSSPVTTDETPTDTGGIDFRVMNIVTQPMAGITSLNLALPKLNNLAQINLDQEMQQMKNMLSSGNLPSGDRIKEYVAACYQKGEWANRAEDVIACLIEVCRLQEEEVSETSIEIKEAMVIADSLSAAI